MPVDVVDDLLEGQVTAPMDAPAPDRRGISGWLETRRGTWLREMFWIPPERMEHVALQEADKAVLAVAPESHQFGEVFAVDVGQSPQCM
jgi:hypothetical protein